MLVELNAKTNSVFELLPSANSSWSLFYPIIERDNYLFAMVKLASVYCNETKQGAQHRE